MIIEKLDTVRVQKKTEDHKQVNQKSRKKCDNNEKGKLDEKRKTHPSQRDELSDDDNKGVEKSERKLETFLLS